MVDRYRSILDESKLDKSSFILDSDPHRFDHLIKKTDTCAVRMREQIRRYQKATTPE